jgi:dCMP deaminase
MSSTTTVDGSDGPVLIDLSWVDPRPNWDTWFLEGAGWVSQRADCRRRQHGALVVDADHRIVGQGYNGAPAGTPGCLAGACPRGLLSYDEVSTMTDYDSGPGRCISTHAEVNALLDAGRTRCKGATIYITGEPCPRCRKTIEAAGISRIVFP